MRAPSIALASATIALSLLSAGCGDDAPDTAQTPPTSQAPVASTPAVDPAAPAESDPVAPSDADPVDPSDLPQGNAQPSKDTITEAIAANTDLSTLKTAVGAAGLEATLEQPGPYTVFAPNNDAFAKLGSQLDTLLQPSAKGSLANILKFHVVSGELSVKDLKDGDLLTTLQGTRLRVDKKGNNVEVGNGLGKATIVSGDSDATNGVIHLVDSVMTPKK